VEGFAVDPELAGDGTSATEGREVEPESDRPKKIPSQIPVATKIAPKAITKAWRGSFTEGLRAVC
jgi:hypothetical protein